MLLSCVVIKILNNNRFLTKALGLLQIKRDLIPIKRDLIPIKRDLLPIKRDLLPIKRDLLPIKRDLLPIKRDLLPIKRDLLPDLNYQHVIVRYLTTAISPRSLSKETYSSVKRDLLQCQKRPTTVSKETYYRPDKSHLATKLLGRVFEDSDRVLGCVVVEEYMRHWEVFFCKF
jgi:hypothetical protein